MARAALVLRGHHYRAATPERHGIDWRLAGAARARFLTEPLGRLCGGVDVYLTTYDSPLLSRCAADLGAVSVEVCPEANDQRKTCAAALRAVADCGREYDLVAVTRFDYEPLLNPLCWGNVRPECVNFLFREWDEAQWTSHKSVCDTLFLLPQALAAGLARAVDEITITPHWVHAVYLPAERNCRGMLNVQDDEYYCSNTSYAPNPVFNLVRVPYRRSPRRGPAPVATAGSSRRAKIERLKVLLSQMGSL